MPLVMVYTLLTELLKLTDSPSPQEPWRHGDLDLTTLSGHCVFAIHLYHSWYGWFTYFFISTQLNL